jgi:acetyl-CoA acyltransferase
MPEAVLVSAVRTPVGRAPKGALSTTRPDDLAATRVVGALDRIPALDKIRNRRRHPWLRPARRRTGIQHCALGSPRSGLPSKSPASPSTASAPPALKPSPRPICASVPVAPRGHRRRSGIHEPDPDGRHSNPAPIHGSLSTIPHRCSPWASPPSASPATMASPREDQDAFALASHQKAIAAQAAGRFTDELIPVTVTSAVPGKSRKAGGH